MAIFTSIMGAVLSHGWIYLLSAIATITSTLAFRFLKPYKAARNQFPGPPVKNLLVGNLDQIMSDNVHEKWLQWNREYGQIYQAWTGPFSRMIYIGHPDLIAEIATANWPKSSSQYDGFRPLDGDALFVQSDHERWKVQSKRLAPAFQPKVIQSQYPCLAKHLENFVQHLDSAAAAAQQGDDHRGGVADLSSLNILLSLDFIGDIAFGTQLDAIVQGPECRISQLFEMILPELMKCGLFPLRGKIPIMKKTRIMNRAIVELRGMARDAIQNARKTPDGQEIVGANKPGKKIFEILALQTEDDGSYTFTSQELEDNYIAFLVAGGDPTAHTMSFLVYQVLRNPTILEKVQAEVDAQIPLEARIPTFEQCRRLPYLNMVIKETLRYSSPGFGTFRICKSDTTVAGIKLPANTTLALWNPAVHRDPQLWEDADKFDPERWRSGQESHQVRGSYFPFSYGPRSCTGQGLAMLEMTLTLATLFRRYDLQLDDGFELEYLPSFTLKPKNGLPVKVTRRQS